MHFTVQFLAICLSHQFIYVSFLSLYRAPIRFKQKDYFYMYISYAINRKKSEKLCITQSAYFKKIQDDIGDKLGVNSFLVQPIQRLPKYRLLLSQLFSELGKRFGVHDDSIKNELGACCLAEKRIQRILNILDGSVEISDIVDCEVS